MYGLYVRTFINWNIQIGCRCCHTTAICSCETQLTYYAILLFICITHLLSVKLKLLFLLLLLYHQLDVEMSRSSDTNDGRAELGHRLLGHGRQRCRMLPPLVLGPTMEIKCNAVNTRVEGNHCRQSDPEISDLLEKINSQRYWTWEMNTLNTILFNYVCSIYFIS